MLAAPGWVLVGFTPRCQSQVIWKWTWTRFDVISNRNQVTRLLGQRGFIQISAYPALGITEVSRHEMV